MIKLAGFPGIAKLNVKRTKLFNDSHNDKKPLTARVGYWIAHKALSVVAIPTNAVATGVGLVGMTATASTLGAYKIIRFAISLGNVKPTFPIGFNWLAERTFSSLANVFANVGEVLYDGADLVHQGYRGVKYVLTALKLDFVSRQLTRLVKFVGERLDKGFEKAGSDEYLPTPISLFKGLNEATKRLSCFEGDQPVGNWFEHKFLSALNIPVNAAVATLSGAASVAGLVAACGKALLYAATNIHISIPTGYAYTGTIFQESSYNVLRNTAELAADVAVMAYRISEALHATQVVAKVGQLLAFIPKAILT